MAPVEVQVKLFVKAVSVYHTIFPQVYIQENFDGKLSINCPQQFILGCGRQTSSTTQIHEVPVMKTAFGRLYYFTNTEYRLIFFYSSRINSPLKFWFELCFRLKCYIGMCPRFKPLPSISRRQLTRIIYSCPFICYLSIYFVHYKLTGMTVKIIFLLFFQGRTTLRCYCRCWLRYKLQAEIYISKTGCSFAGWRPTSRQLFVSICLLLLLQVGHSWFVQKTSTHFTQEVRL